MNLNMVKMASARKLASVLIEANEGGLMNNA